MHLPFSSVLHGGQIDSLAGRRDRYVTVYTGEGGGGLRLGGRGVLIQKPTLFEVKPEKDKTFGIVSSVSVSYAP